MFDSALPAVTGVFMVRSWAPIKVYSLQLHTLWLTRTFFQPSRLGRRARWRPSSLMSRSEEGRRGWQAAWDREEEECRSRHLRWLKIGRRIQQECVRRWQQTWRKGHEVQLKTVTQRKGRGSTLIIFMLISGLQLKRYKRGIRAQTTTKVMHLKVSFSLA